MKRAINAVAIPGPICAISLLAVLLSVACGGDVPKAKEASDSPLTFWAGDRPIDLTDWVEVPVSENAAAEMKPVDPELIRGILKRMWIPQTDDAGTAEEFAMHPLSERTTLPPR